jgi:hypothetical protein
MFERRELRNQLKQSNSELRCYLDMMSERVRFQVRAVEDIAAGFGKPKTRNLSLDSGTPNQIRTRPAKDWTTAKLQSRADNGQVGSCAPFVSPG